MLHLTLADNTKRNHAGENERRLRRILDNALDMIFIFSPDTLRFEYMNRGAVEGIGYSREEMLKMSPPDILQLITEAECRAYLAPLVSGKRKMRRFETMVRNKEGRDLPVEVQLQLVQEQDDSGSFVAIVRDITRRRFSERELRRQKNLLLQVIDSDPNIIFVKDGGGRFLLANRALADFFGVTVQNLVGKKNSEFDLNRQEMESFLAADREVIKNGREVISNDALMIDGKQHWYRTVKRPLFQDDGSIRVLGIAVDVTEMKQSGIELVESYKELQRLSLYLENVRAEERAQIGRNLHDEMGATLTALKMRIAWLTSRLPAGMPQLSAEVEHISALVSDGIRTLRQVASDLRPNLLDNAGLAAAVKDLVNRFRRDTEIECAVVFPEMDIALNENQSVTIFRIIQESLSNVAKHARASKVEIDFSANGESLLVLIKDDGIGFDPAGKEHSFGLLGMRERAQMIGGTSTISSVPGRGTQVSLSIPASTHL